MSGDDRVILEGVVGGTDATDAIYLFNPFPDHKLLIRSAFLGPNVAVATHASNYITTTLTTSATLATHTTNSSGGSALVAGTRKDLTLSGTGLALEVAAGGSIAVAVAKAGTGPAYEHVVQVLCSRIRN